MGDRCRGGKSWTAILLAWSLAAAATGAAQPPPQPLLATEVLHQVNAALVGADRARQLDIVRPLLQRAKKDAAAVEEQLALAELYFLAFNPRESDAIFSRHLHRTDRLGRMAWIRHQQIQFRAFDRHEETEPAIEEFRRRFQVSPEDLTYTSAMVLNQANRYAQRGDHARAGQLVLDDVAKLPLGLPLRSFPLLGTFFDSLRQAGRGSEARAILESHRTRLRERVAGTRPPVSSTSALKAAPYSHRPGHLHADWDTGNADDDPAYDRERFLAAMAIDRLKQLDAILDRPPSEDRPAWTDATFTPRRQPVSIARGSFIAR